MKIQTKIFLIMLLLVMVVGTLLKQSKLVTTHVVRLKLFRLKAEGGQKGTIAILLAETSDSCTKHGFKMRFFLTVFSLQTIHLSSYVNC